MVKIDEIERLLISLGICSKNSIKTFFPKVRDSDDIKVMRCEKSGVVFLSRSDHISSQYYNNKESLNYWSARTRQEALLACQDDDMRRAAQFRPMIEGGKWLDVGTGAGGILDYLSSASIETCAVEPQDAVRNELTKCGYKVFKKLEEVESNYFDITTLFHVFEHMTNPLDALKNIAKKLRSGGGIIIEVPHAKDVMISFFNIDAFKSFTFWSEHLILHTRESLELMLCKAGFVNVRITGHQRYPLANHMHWLARGKPNGHNIWKTLRNAQLDSAYEKTLQNLDMTDTLIAIAEKTCRKNSNTHGGRL